MDETAKQAVRGQTSDLIRAQSTCKHREEALPLESDFKCQYQEPGAFNQPPAQDKAARRNLHLRRI